MSFQALTSPQQENQLLCCSASHALLKVAEWGGGLNHTVYSLSNTSAVCHPSHHWSHPLPGPQSAPLQLPPSPLGAVGQPWHCFDWDLCHLWLLNHVDTRVIHAWRGCLCLDPNTHSHFSATVSGPLCRPQLCRLSDSLCAKWASAKIRGHIWKSLKRKSMQSQNPL